MNTSHPSQGHVRAMTDDDLALVRQWRNHEDVRRYMYTQHEITLAEHQHWFERAAQDNRRHLLIFELESTPLGFINLHEISTGNVADWGFYISPDAAKGTGRQLGCTTLDYAFGALKLHKVCGQALAFNERSIRFHHALGFQQEGVLRDQHFDGNNYHAIMCFGLLAHEWESKN